MQRRTVATLTASRALGGLGLTIGIVAVCLAGTSDGPLNAGAAVLVLVTSVTVARTAAKSSGGGRPA